MIETDNRNKLVEYPLSNQMILTLFKSEILNIDTKEKYEWFIELLEGVEDPKMLQLSVGLSISNNRKTDITMLSYQECIKDKDFWYLELYNTVIETIERKNISTEIINSFAYIDDITHIGDIRYIKSIVIQWLNEGEFTCEIIIKQLTELSKSEKIKFKDVKLFWYSMDLKNFLRVVYTLSKLKIKIEIVAQKELLFFAEVLKRLMFKIQLFGSYKLVDQEEHILWNQDRNKNQLELRKWYYIPYLNSDIAIEISNGNFQYFEIYRENINDNKVISSAREALCFQFSFKSVPISNLKTSDFNKLIKFDNKKYQFNYNIIKKGSYRNKNMNWGVCFHHGELNIHSDIRLKFTYSELNRYIKLNILGTPLSILDIEELVRFLKNVGMIRSLLLLINDPSSIITILDLFQVMPLLKTIAIKLQNTLNDIELNIIKEWVLRHQAKANKVKIYAPTIIPLTFT